VLNGWWTHFSVVAETDRLWRVTFDRPPINLVTPEMLVELPKLIDQMEAAPALRVVVYFDSFRWPGYKRRLPAALAAGRNQAGDYEARLGYHLGRQPGQDNP
jgi:hypothetical protein